MKSDVIRDGAGPWWQSLGEGWARLREGAAGALTRFLPGKAPAAGNAAETPAATDIDEDGLLPSFGWALIGGDVFEDARRVLVRLEAPGLRKEDFDLQVDGDVLVVRGEKRFERESGQGGRWHTVQCAYGVFERRVPLPSAVRADEARATYRDGVLKVELPKAQGAASRRIEIRAA